MSTPTAVDLELRGLEKSYGETLAVKALDLNVAAGEFLALLGPSGCGKTTTLRMIAGFVQPSAGTIRLKGRDITAMPPHKRNTGMVFQSYALFPHMTVRKNIEFGLRSHRVERKEAERRARDALELVDLRGFEDRLPRELSGGQQQRVAVARVLALKPSLLLFDEPLSNLDAKLRIQMRYEIRRLQREVGVTALFVTHDQEEAMTMADRIVVMNEGSVEQIGSPGDIYDHPTTRFVADFIGSTNLFEGEVIAAGGSPVFRTRAGVDIMLPRDVGHRGACAISVRPEKIDVRGLDESVGLAGRICSAIQLGAVMEYLIMLSSGEIVKAHEQRRSETKPRPVGVDVRVSWMPSSAVLLPR